MQNIADNLIAVSYTHLDVYKRQEENKGDKMQLLYNYLTGVEFKGQVEAIAEGFLAMKNSITRERMQMEKLWKERDKQLDKVLMCTSAMYGSCLLYTSRCV